MTKEWQIYSVLIEEGGSGATAIAVIPVGGVILMEDNGVILMEDGGSILME